MFILLLFSWFSSMHFCVRWGNFISPVAQILSGLLQDNVLSPKFYNVCIDNSLRKLESSDYGNKLFGCFCSAIFHVDDIVLLCGSMVGLHCMIDLCVEYSNVFGITFDPLKSDCMAFHPTKNSFCLCKNLNFDCHSSDWVSKIHYLGINDTNNNLKCIFDVNIQLTISFIVLFIQSYAMWIY